MPVCHRFTVEYKLCVRTEVDGLKGFEKPVSPALLTSAEVQRPLRCISAAASGIAALRPNTSATIPFWVSRLPRNWLFFERRFRRSRLKRNALHMPQSNTSVFCPLVAIPPSQHSHPNGLPGWESIADVCAIQLNILPAS